MSEKDTRFDVPFPMAAALSEHVRESQMAYCIKQKLPRLWPVTIGQKWINIACYGPSLKDTWQDLERPIIAVSGAHDFLIERGVIPDYFLSIDPRKDQLAFYLKPHKDVQYLMASCCHPFAWSILKGYNVKMFHVISGDHTRRWLEMYDPKSLLIVGGSSVGLCAFHVGGVLGYRRSEVHGMDGCYHGDERHAGKHYGHNQNKIKWTANGREWDTSKIMMNSNIELLNFARNFPFLSVLHGEGLQQDLVAESDIPNIAVHGTPKADLVRDAIIRIQIDFDGEPERDPISQEISG